MLQSFQKEKLEDISPVEKTYPPGIYAMASYGEQQIALASTEGLWYGDPQRLQNINAESGLAFNMVTGLSATEKGIWLLIYDRGLAYFDLEQQKNS